MQVRTVQDYLDDAWKTGVAEVLAKRKIRRAHLARLVQCSPAAITRLLNPTEPITRDSKVAARVAELTGVPMTTKVEDELKSLVAKVEALKTTDPEGYQFLLRMMQQFLSGS